MTNPDDWADEHTADTIGALYDRLPAGQWVALPEHGVRIQKWEQPQHGTADSAGEVSS